MTNHEIEPPIQDVHFDPTVHQQLLQAGCQELGLRLEDDQIAQFERYYRELVTWNRRFNLTAITDYEEVQIKHFLDCLSALPVIAEELNEPLPLTRPLRLVDVGAGAGFPGVPLKIAAPDVYLSLMDGTGKKITYLNHMVAVLDLQKSKVIQGRAEELGRQQVYRAGFDLVTARAVAPLNTLVEYLLPLVAMNGMAVILKGGSAPQEFMEARNAIETLGGETLRLAPVKVPYLDAARVVLISKKVRRTPNLFPRGQGLARKQPL